MSINFQALTLGSADLYLDDQKIGPVTDIRITKEVERFAVELADKAELGIRYLVPVRRAFTISMNIKELAPPALSYFLSGGESTKITGGTEQVRELTRLYAGIPSVLKYPFSGPIVVKSVASETTYAEGVDYTVDRANRRIYLKESGSIIPGELLEATYSYNFQASREIPLSANGFKTCKVELLHRYPDGQSVLSIVLRRVEIDASGVFALEPDEISGVPLNGRCLADDNFPASPFGYIRIYGTIMSEMNPR